MAKKQVNAEITFHRKHAKTRHIEICMSAVFLEKSRNELY